MFSIAVGTIFSVLTCTSRYYFSYFSLVPAFHHCLWSVAALFLVSWATNLVAPLSCSFFLAFFG